MLAKKTDVLGDLTKRAPSHGKKRVEGRTINSMQKRKKQRIHFWFFLKKKKAVVKKKQPARGEGLGGDRYDSELKNRREKRFPASTSGKGKTMTKEEGKKKMCRKGR